MKVYFILICLLFVGCKSKKDNYSFEEKNRKENILDTGTNKLKKFYDTLSKKLLAEGEYSNGVENGRYIVYNTNGTIKSKVNYNQGLENGKAEYFDTTGVKVAEDYFYFGLHSGNAVRFVNGKLKSYSFYSLENEEIIHFVYDSLQGRYLDTLFSNFFYYTVSKYYSNSNWIGKMYETEYFLYTPNPPLEEFTYSLVKTDKNKKIKSTLLEFDKTKPWSKFDINPEWYSDSTLIAIKLVIFDSINKIHIVMLKFLPKDKK